MVFSIARKARRKGDLMSNDRDTEGGRELLCVGGAMDLFNLSWARRLSAAYLGMQLAGITEEQTNMGQPAPIAK